MAIGLGGSLGSGHSQLLLSYIFTTIFKKQIVFQLARGG